MSSVTTKHSDIFEYWKDKFITKDGRVVHLGDVGYDSSNCIDVVSDWDYPCCWGCGKPIFSSNSKMLSLRNKHIKEDKEDFVSLWNDDKVKSKLQRCHIIPNALGGEDKSNNLFLLCPECHLLSPDTANPKYFLRWVYRQNQKYYNGKFNPRYILNQVSSDLAEQGIDMEKAVSLINTIDPNMLDYPHLKEFARERLGSHCSTVVDESFIALTEDFILQSATRAVLEV